MRLGSLQVAALVAAVVLCRVAAIPAIPLYDDAFITYRHARNLANGQGLFFNPGAPWEPVLGPTTPGYALLLAALHWLGFELPAASRVVNIVCDAVSAWLVAGLLGRAVIPTILTLAAFAAMPLIVRISVGGMEPPLLLMLALAASRDAGHAPFRSGCWCAVACTVRPEGMLLLPGIVWTLRRSARALLRFLTPVLVVGIVCAAILLSIYGTVVPHSVIAKSAIEGAHRSDTLVGAWRATLGWAFVPSIWALPLTPLAVLGIWCALRQRALQPVVLFSLLIVGGYLVMRPPLWSWYFYVPLAIWSIGLGLGAGAAATHWARTFRPSLAFAAALGAVFLVGVAAVLRPTPVGPRVYAPLRAWGRTLPSGITILAQDLGAVGYFAQNAVVVDDAGLVWPPAVGSRAWQPLVEMLQPDYLLLIAKQGNVEIMKNDARVARRYVPVARFSAAGHTELNPNPASLPHSWTQDYLLYRRVEQRRKAFTVRKR